MKKITIVVLSGLMMLGAISCGNRSSSKESKDQSEASTETVTASSKWDSMLDEYENYVDQYISLMRKVSNGDISVMSEYQKFMEKTQALSKKLDKMDAAEATNAQIKRYQDISMKMANAAADF